MTTWGNEVGDGGSHRRRQSADAPESAAWRRLWVGLGAGLVVVLAYPFYEYAVHARLAERDLRKSAGEVQADLRAADEAASHGASQQRRQMERLAFLRRLASVRVQGISDAAGGAVVMVDLQGLTVSQAAGSICAQAAGWLQRPVSGELIRVQASRGQRPAQDVGTIRCE